MDSTGKSLVGDNGSFLLDDLLDCRSQKKQAFERAALITPFVKSVTIGPNSSFCLESAADPPSPLASVPCTPERSQLRRVILSKMSPVTPEDVRILQQKLKYEAEDRRIREKVRRQMEVRVEKERLHYAEIQRDLEARRLEAERKHREKVEALERQIEAALKIEAQEEENYQKHRADLAMNARKIQEQQERDFRENLRQHDEHFDKQEMKFNEVLKSSKLEGPQINEYKKLLEDIKSLRNSNRSSLDFLKRLCMKLEELTNNLFKTSREYETRMIAQQAQKEAEAIANLAKAQEQAALKAAEQAIAAKTLAPPPAPPKIIPANNGTGRKYAELMQLLVDKQNSTKNLSEQADLQNLRFALKMAVNGPINMLHEQNRDTLIEGFQKLSELLSGQRVITNKGAVSVADHPEASDWTKLRVAEKLIDVCDKKPETIFFVAALSLALWQKFPEFGIIFIAKLFKECPFLVPFKPSQHKGQSDEDFLNSWGYRVVDGVNEKYEHYQLRTSRFSHLMAALWISFPRQGESSPHPFSISHGWEYLVNILNAPADPMYLHIIDKVLEISGSTMQVTFGKQFVKLMIVLQQHYLPPLERQVDEAMRAAYNRLGTTMTKFASENRFPPPKGKINPKYW